MLKFLENILFNYLVINTNFNNDNNCYALLLNKNDLLNISLNSNITLDTKIVSTESVLYSNIISEKLMNSITDISNVRQRILLQETRLIKLYDYLFLKLNGKYNTNKFTIIDSYIECCIKLHAYTKQNEFKSDLNSGKIFLSNFQNEVNILNKQIVLKIKETK